MKKYMKLLSLILFTSFSLYASEIQDISKGDDIKEMFVRNRVSQNTVTTHEISHQFTADNYLQQIALYENHLIFTNLEGPRKGCQIILDLEGHLIDMRNEYRKHKDYFSHRYSWGEIKTYEDHQIVIYKQAKKK